MEEPVEATAAMESEDSSWSPPPTLATWGRASLGVVRFAVANHLLVELGYKSSTRLIEPYSLRGSSAGALLLYGIRATPRDPLLPGRQNSVGRGDHQTLPAGVRDRVRLFGQPVRPPCAAAAGLPRLGARRSSARSRCGPVYVVRCTTCGKEFGRKTRSTRMRKHKAPAAGPVRVELDKFVRMA